MRNAWYATWVFVFLAVTAFSGPSFADHAVEPFFGDFVGRSISLHQEGLSERDISVSIQPSGNKEFLLKWTTITHKADGRTKHKSYAIIFQPSGRANIFSSAMRKDVFGHKSPLDPLKGDPFVWARIDGKALIVYALIITDSGGYEMQEYTRTLSEKGLDLRFTRIRNGKPQRTITGTLERTAK